MMICSAPRRRAAITPQRPTAPSPTTATVLPGRDVGGERRVVAGAHHVARASAATASARRPGRPAARRAFRPPAVRAPPRPGRRRRRPRPSSRRAGTRSAGPRWQKTQVPSDHANGATTRSPALTRADVGADVLDDADELVAHAASGLARLHRVVGPEIAAADGGAGDAHERIGRLDDPGVGDGLDADIARAVHHGRSHTRHSSSDRRGVTDPVDPGTGRPPQRRRAWSYPRPVDAGKRDPRVPDFAGERRISPEQAGLPWYGDNRRVPGLRREEVAMLAGVSVDYYTRLERGNARGVSESVLEAFARALQLDEAERAHLFDLARAAPMRRRAGGADRRSSGSGRACSGSSTRSPPRRRSSATGVWTSSPPTISAAPSTRSTSTARRGRRTRRASSSSTRAPVTSTPTGNSVATDAVAVLRSEAGRDPYDRGLSDLVGELSTRSESSAPAGPRTTSVSTTPASKRFHHPVVGDLSLTYETMQLAADRA